MGKRLITKGTVLVAVLFVIAGLAAGCLLRIIEQLTQSIDPAEGTDVILGIGVFGTAVITVVLVLLCLIVNYCTKKNAVEKIKQQNVEIEKRDEELQEMVLQFQNALDMVEQSSRAKSDFLNRMSHDLRTPMNAIMGYSMLLNQIADSPEKVRDYADKITVSGQILLELINDVLDMSSIESGNIKLNKSEFSLSDALDNVMVALKPQIRERNQKLNYYTTSAIEKDLFIGDKQRLCQILQNLLSNAIKYSADGEAIDFIVNVIDNDDDVQVLFQIKDNGCGMSTEYLERIFQPFERDDNPEIRTVQGTGLGLCIAKHFIEMMNGSIKIDTKKDVGTLVTVMIRLTPADGSLSGETLEGADENVLRGMHFLAAEDNESNGEILKEVLASKGASCVIVENGKEAIRLFESSEEKEYDMILMDIQMPVMNGYEAAVGIRNSNHPRAKDIQIIAMTADAFDDDVQRALLVGMNAHVAKPLDLQAFVNTVKSLKK